MTARPDPFKFQMGERVKSKLWSDSGVITARMHYRDGNAYVVAMSVGGSREIHESNLTHDGDHIPESPDDALSEMTRLNQEMGLYDIPESPLSDEVAGAR